MSVINNMVVIAQEETSFNVQERMLAESGYSMLAGLKLKNYFKQLISGIHPATVQTKTNMVKASGTITLSSWVNNDTITVHSVVFTAKTSGATGAFQVNIGADDTAAAVNCVTAINADTTLDGLVLASSSLGVITITALIPGELGNTVATAISAHGTASATYLAGGTNGDVERTHYYGSVVGG